MGCMFLDDGLLAYRSVFCNLKWAFLGCVFLGVGLFLDCVFLDLHFFLYYRTFVVNFSSDETNKFSPFYISKGKNKF